MKLPIWNINLHAIFKACGKATHEHDVIRLTHWGRATHICVSKLTIIASDNGLSPGRRQAIIWNNAGILSIELLGTNFSEILFEILTFSFKKMRLKVLSAKWRPFCLGLNVLTFATIRYPVAMATPNYRGNQIRHNLLVGNCKTIYLAQPEAVWLGLTLFNLVNYLWTLDRWSIR